MSDDPLGSFREQLVDGVRGEPRRRRRRRAVVGAAAAALVVAAGAVAVSARGSDDQHVTADGPTTTTTPPLDVPGHPSTRAGLLGARRLAGAPAGRCLVRHPGPVDPAAVGRVEPHAPQERVVERGLPRGGEEEKPEVSVTWRRLDDPSAPRVRADAPGTNAFTPGHGWFMIASEMDPISIGCWEVTGSYKGHELNYVFEVKPQLAVHPRPSDAGDGALVAGVVRYDARINCYRLGEHPVVWPTGTTVSDDGEVITLADGTQVHMGDHVSGGGGFAPFRAVGQVVRSLPPASTPIARSRSSTPAVRSRSPGSGSTVGGMTDERVDPPLVADEKATLAGFLDFHRDTFLWKIDGLVPRPAPRRRLPAVRPDPVGAPAPPGRGGPRLVPRLRRRRPAPAVLHRGRPGRGPGRPGRRRLRRPTSPPSAPSASAAGRSSTPTRSTTSR